MELMVVKYEYTLNYHDLQGHSFRDDGKVKLILIDQ